MISEKAHNKFFGFWKLDTFGNFSISMLLIAVLSGILLAVSYDVENPAKSISLILISNPAASFLRNMHYWSAQLFLIFSVLHVWDHFVRKTESKLKFGVWIRLGFALFFIFFVMISGFIIKGDADSANAQIIISQLFKSVPLFGDLLSNFLVGKQGDYQLLYIHHVATATIFLLIILYEHSGLIWGKVKTFLQSLFVVTVLSILITPLIKTEFDVLIRGPWYFLGLQEILHYLSVPVISVWALIILLAIFILIPKFKARFNDITKNSFMILFLIYSFLTVFAFYFRGEDWEMKPFGAEEYTTGFDVKLLNPFVSLPDSTAEFAVIGNRYEGCITCHGDVSGFSPAHSPEALGCYSCHRGNPFEMDKEKAHANMIRIPGNLSDAGLSCGTTNCHPGIHERVNASLMNNLTGMISVDRFVFDEIYTLDDTATVKSLGDTPADKHLRQLCVSCHTGAVKTEFGAITHESRGGGCNACHLNYSENALNELQGDSLKLKRFHPSLSLNITDDHCFGCHSRSGRITMNYKGLHETQLNKNEINDTSNYEILEDGRVALKVIPDVHYEKGMACIDCHISYEVMGDGNSYLHKEEQLILKCEDCHSEKVDSKKYTGLDDEERKIFDLREFKQYGTRVLATAKGERGILNAFVSGEEKYLITKLSSKKLPLKEPAKVCTQGKAHDEVSCSTCHSSWAPQCIGCHTEYFPEENSYDHLTRARVEGSWDEFVGEYLPEPPVMGIRKTGRDYEVIGNIPGMVLTIDKKGGSEKIFKRLYAPAVPHTINKKARDCQSCHFNSLALGYGRGQLKLENKRITFEAYYAEREEDGLPEDAWIGFLTEPTGNFSTRSNVFPLNLELQKRILRVGVCLTCHKDNPEIVDRMLDDFSGALKSVSKNCTIVF